MGCWIGMLGMVCRLRTVASIFGCLIEAGVNGRFGADVDRLSGTFSDGRSGTGAGRRPGAGPGCRIPAGGGHRVQAPLRGRPLAAWAILLVLLVTAFSCTEEKVPEGPKVNIRGTLFLDDLPVKEASIRLLEGRTERDTIELEAFQEGRFEFQDVSGVTDKVRFSIKIAGFEEKTVDSLFDPTKSIKIALRTSDLEPDGQAPPAGTTGDTPLPAASAHPFGLDIYNMPADTLRQYLGQLFLVGYDGLWDSPTSKNVIRPLLERYQPGGFLLFRRNIPLHADTSADLDTVRAAIMEFTHSVQEASREKNGLPLLLAVQQEGGVTSQIGRGIVTETPPAMAIGSLRDENAAYDAGQIIGTELALLGFNMNLAPVADIAPNEVDYFLRDRCFGTDRAVVTPLAGAFFQGQHEAGIISVARHFPGHGHTRPGLSTPGIPLSDHTLESLDQAMDPFRELVREGAESIMTAHLRLAMYQNAAVTFDPQSMVDLLRRKEKPESDSTHPRPAGFDGVVVTDDLCSPTVISQEDNADDYAVQVEKAVIAAFEAGHDLLLLAQVFPDSADEEALLGWQKKYRRRLTLSEFDRIYQALGRHIFEEPDPVLKDERIARLRGALSRVLRLKLTQQDRAYETRTVEGFHQAMEAGRHREKARALFSRSFGLKAAEGGFPNLGKMGSEDRVYVFFPTRFTSYGSIKKLKEAGDAGERLAKHVRAQDLPAALEKHLGKRVDLRFEMDLKYPPPKDYVARAEQVVETLREGKARAAVFIICNQNQWELFTHILRELAKSEGFKLNRVIVILAAHPNGFSIYGEHARDLVPKINVVLAYGGTEKRAEILAEMLAAGDKIGRDSVLPAVIQPTVTAAPIEIKKRSPAAAGTAQTSRAAEPPLSAANGPG